jgi:hypothetical protein
VNEQRSTISIADARASAREFPELAPHLLALIDAAEGLRREHDVECGCTRPGSPVCWWSGPDGRLLAAFEFDEVTVT